MMLPGTEVLGYFIQSAGWTKATSVVSEKQDPIKEVESALAAFEHEFARLTAAHQSAAGLSLTETETEQRALAELRTKHLGKKSPIAAAKKLIGKVASDERASFGQLVQQTEKSIAEKIEAAEQALRALIESARTARETVDVTIPGRRPRP